jgi:hypothetical protein
MVVLKDFISAEEIDDLKAACSRILDEMAAQELPRVRSHPWTTEVKLEFFTELCTNFGVHE